MLNNTALLMMMSVGGGAENKAGCLYHKFYVVY